MDTHPTSRVPVYHGKAGAYTQIICEGEIHGRRHGSKLNLCLDGTFFAVVGSSHALCMDPACL